jgi:hypothetical protein
MRSAEKIVVVAAVAGVGVALFAAYQTYLTRQAAQAGAAAAQNPVATAATEIGTTIENWFSHLWGGSSSGGTPEATSTAQ